jgi:predicted MFS family arabinose efflux permease
VSILAPMAAGYLLSTLFRNINAVIAPYLVEELKLSLASLGMLTASYLLAFALMQIPFGVLIDRFGARRVQGATLLVAASGAMLFAVAQQLETLILARALIGAGVAVALMSGFAALAFWVPPPDLPRALGFLMAFGGIGYILAGAPTEFLVAALGWRALFGMLALATIGAAAAVWHFVPDQPGTGENWSSLLAGIRRICTAEIFWRIGLLTMLTCGTGFALHGLWAGLWLADVAGLGQDAVAWCLSAMSVGLLAGSAACGPMTALGRRMGLGTIQVVGVLALAFLSALALLAAGPTNLSLPLWIVVGFLINPISLSYAVLVQHFGQGMAGRVNACINTIVIAESFCVQAGMGWTLDYLTRDAGFSTRAAYGLCFGALAGLGLLAMTWCWPVLRPAERSRER